jgi:hypothetical protein
MNRIPDDLRHFDPRHPIIQTLSRNIDRVAIIVIILVFIANWIF